MKTTIRVTVIAAVLVGVFFGWRWWQSQQPSEVPEGIVSGNGRIEAVQVDISTKFAGRIAEVLANEGDLVEKGQLLVRMDSMQLKATLAQSKAMQAETEQAVKQAAANITKSESELALAEKEADRTQKLRDKQAASQSVLDQKQSVVETTRATLNAMKAALRTQEFAVEAAKAQVNEIQTQLDDAELKSPTRGRVIYQLAEAGEVVSVGGKVLTILDLTDVYMEVYVPADAAARLAIGAEARVVVDVAPQYAARAKVTFVSPEAQFTPKQVETTNEREKLMFRVKVQLPPERVEPYIDRIKTGIRGVAYLRVDPLVPWPERLEQRFPDTPPEVGMGTSNSVERTDQSQ